jgi:predicted SAM-dependent methyltransferase
MSMFHGEIVRLKALWRPKTVSQYFRTHDKKMLNLGAGPHKIEGWLTADAFKSEADIYIDVTRKTLPFEDNSWDIIYSEHMLEHIYIDKVPNLLAEIHRILKPGGIFRVTVPDLQIHAKNYVEGNTEFFKPIVDKYMARWPKQKNKYWLIRGNGGAFMSRAVQRFYRHRWMYDFETLSSCLKEVGFSSSVKQECRKSISPEAGVLDREDRAFETLYIDSTK